MEILCLDISSFRNVALESPRLLDSRNEDTFGCYTEILVDEESIGPEEHRGEWKELLPSLGVFTFLAGEKSLDTGKFPGVALVCLRKLRFCKVGQERQLNLFKQRSCSITWWPSCQAQRAPNTQNPYDPWHHQTLKAVNKMPCVRKQLSVCDKLSSSLSIGLEIIYFLSKYAYTLSLPSKEAFSAATCRLPLWKPRRNWFLPALWSLYWNDIHPLN